MRLRDREIRGLPVFTRGGQRVGKVAAIEIDADSHAVSRYVVTRSRGLAAILPAELLVDPTQVVELDDEKMVVNESAVPAEAKAKAMRVREAAHAASAAMRSE
jgi:sporulation protein YlmC with PRC-barrel domain